MSRIENVLGYTYFVVAVALTNVPTPSVGAPRGNATRSYIHKK